MNGKLSPLERMGVALLVLVVVGMALGTSVAWYRATHKAEPESCGTRVAHYVNDYYADHGDMPSTSQLDTFRSLACA